MKIKDLTDEQWEIIAKVNPAWMADNRTIWMVDNHTAWMVYNRTLEVPEEIEKIITTASKLTDKEATDEA